MSDVTEVGSLISKPECNDDEEKLGAPAPRTAVASFYHPALSVIFGATALLCGTFAYLHVASPSPDAASACHIGPKTECKMLTVAEAAYRYGMNDWMIRAPRCSQSLRDSLGWQFVRGFNRSTPSWWMPDGKDFDYIGWWTNGSDCIFVFQGSDSKSDFRNDNRIQPTVAYGFQGVHLGIKRELESVVAQMDFPAMRRRCTGDVTVVGHSLGGGLAQLFSAALNKADDPLKALLKVDYLYTFGAMGVATSALRNDQSADGCFLGEQFWNAEHDADGNLYVDILGSKSCCSGMLPVMSKKTLSFSNASKQTFLCGISLPAEKKNPGFKLHMPRKYADFLSCRQ